MLYVVVSGVSSIMLMSCFFFRWKTAYEMRISDWSSDFCSSDLASPSATLIGGAAGVVTMLGLKAFEARFKGPMALLAAIGIDILVDGLVLGLAFLAGEKAGFLLTIALTLEVLFLGSDRKRVVKGKSVYVGVDIGGRGVIK